MTDARYVVVGAGAIGSTIGAQLALAGRDVVLVARGAHLEALRSGGLRYSRPEGTRTLEVAAVGGPEELELTAADVLLLCVKSQDTASALDAWVGRPLAGGGWSEELPVFCAQNGIDNERVVLRRFARTYGMSVVLPASHLSPGAVSASSRPVVGLLTLGRYPSGVDEVARAVGADLVTAGFQAPVVPDVMRWKHAKLLANLGNAVQALCGWDAEGDDVTELTDRVRAEALAVYAAAGLEVVDRDEEAAARAGMSWDAVPDAPRFGGSTWQSLQRGTGRVEVDWLNGEIALLARLHGLEAPANVLLQRLTDRAAASAQPPGRLTAAQILAQLPSD